MKCTSPFRTKEGYTVPCGRCLACRIAYAREWALRLEHELDGRPASFVTLTYAEAPEDLCKAHLQLWIKYIRNNGYKIKYFAAGEYGALHDRPHYHAIIIGLGPEYADYFRVTWGRGITYTGTVTKESIQYVTGYIVDKWASKKNEAWRNHKQRPFQLCSQKIGYKWLMENKINVVRDMSIKYHGKPMAMPRYYCKKLKDEWSDEYKEHIRMATNAAKKAELLKYVDEKDLGGDSAARRQQRKEALETLRYRKQRQDY